MLPKTSIIVFIAVIEVIESHEFNIHESLDLNNDVDLKYRPWTYDNTSKNWISLEGMGVSAINSVIRFHVPDLKWLVVDNNQISRVPTEAFQFLPDLTYISLAGNHINEFELGAFSDVEKLQILDLDSNPIEDMNSFNVFSTLPALERLYLRYCQLRYFDLPENMENLSRLYLSGNSLNSFQASSDSALTHVHLDNNELRYVSLVYFKSLIYIDLSNNRLQGIISYEARPDRYVNRFGGDSGSYDPRYPNLGLFLGDVPTLQYLILSSNEISKIGADTFVGTEALVHVNLTGNQLSEVPAGAFNNLLRLEDILLDSNHITKINYRAFVNLPSLKTISLKNNKISDIDEDAFARLDSSENDVHLFLDNNRIHTLRRNSFVGVKGLKHIGLSNNRIKVISSYSFVDLPNLESLFIEDQVQTELGRSGYYNEEQVTEPTDRMIESHAFFNLSKITFIKISGNVFTNVDAKAFHTLPELLVLDLSDNALVNLSPEAFHDLPKIEDLDLSDNLISETKPETFPKHLKRLNLAWNRVCPVFSCWNVGELRQLEDLDISGITEYLRIEDFAGFPKNITVVMKMAKATSN